MNCLNCHECIHPRTVYKLSCGICLTSYHTQCIQISKNVFRNMTTSNWICRDCINVLPFNNIVDNDNFLKAITNNDNRSYLGCENILFNPFELLPDTNVTAPYSDYDPDMHYYNSSQHLSNLCNSKYYDMEEFNKATLIQKKENHYSMFHCNIRSVTKNRNNLSNHLESLKHEFDIIALSETWLNDNNNKILGFSNYNHVHNYRQTRIGGGVSIF